MLQEVAAPAVELREVLADGVVAAAQLASDAQERAAGARAEAPVEPPAVVGLAPQEPPPRAPTPPTPLSERISLLVRAGVSCFWAFVLIAMLVLLPWRDALQCVQMCLGLATSSVELVAVVLASMQNPTSEVVSLSTEVIRGTRTLIDDVWTGVEITDLTTTAVGNTIVSRDASSLLNWFEGIANTLPASLVEQWRLQIVPFVGDGIVHLELTHSHLDVVGGRFTFAQGQLEKLPNGKIGFRFVMVAVRFGLIWSNPLWELSEQNASSEVTWITGGLTSALQLHPWIGEV